MTSIRITDLHPAGSELFSDSESYLSQMTDEELTLTHGGGWSEVGLIVGGVASIAVGVAGSPVAAAGITSVLAYSAAGVVVGGLLGLGADI